MPAKYSVKVYVEDGIYHVYNRGINKMNIFEDTQDHKVFLSFLKRYLLKTDNEVRPRWREELYKNIDLLAFCLMSNHLHLLLKQNSLTAITTFMRCISNAYTKYFNNKYERIGPLFQGKFKAVLVNKDEYLLYLSRYIHLNPIGHKKSITRSDLARLEQYSYSSYSDYLGKRKTEWVKSNFIVDYFKKLSPGTLSYKEFVESFAISPEVSLENIAIDE